MKVRAAKAEDSEAIASLYMRSRRTHVAFAPLAHSAEEIQDWVARTLIPTGGVSVLVQEDGAVVAMIAVSVKNGSSWIDHLYVAPELTGRGFGRVLLQRATRSLSDPIFLYTFQQNAGARRFYERHGFEPVEFSDGAGNEERCPDVLYRLSKVSDKPVE